MKKTDEDRRFAARFASALQPLVSRDRDDGKSLAEIAADLGVTAAGLQKQLGGGTPSIRTIALAYKKYRLSVPYEDIEFTTGIARRRRTGKKSAEGQLLLPLDITVPASCKALVLRRVPQSVRRYTLKLTVGT
jgi:hypothetical protein